MGLVVDDPLPAADIVVVDFALRGAVLFGYEDEGAVCEGVG